MKKILVEVDESDHNAVCDRCNETFGEHVSVDCPDKKGKFSKFKEIESKAIYNKETIVGVFKQCQDMFPENSDDWEIAEQFILMAKEGKFSKPTLEEVWKEKIKIADERKSFFKFVFIYEGKIYSTGKINDRWSKPVGVIEL